MVREHFAALNFFSNGIPSLPFCCEQCTKSTAFSLKSPPPPTAKTSLASYQRHWGDWRRCLHPHSSPMVSNCPTNELGLREELKLIGPGSVWVDAEPRVKHTIAATGPGPGQTRLSHSFPRNAASLECIAGPRCLTQTRNFQNVMETFVH
jgi:hypothetical protein